MVHPKGWDDHFIQPPSNLQLFLETHQCNPLCADLGLDSKVWPFERHDEVSGEEEAQGDVPIESAVSVGTSSPVGTVISDSDVDGFNKSQGDKKAEEDVFIDNLKQGTMRLTKGRIIQPPSRYLSTPTPPNKSNKEKRKKRNNKQKTDMNEPMQADNRTDN